MSTPSAKRSLFQTPTRAAKRRKASAKKPLMRIPKSLLPETKQFIKSSLTNGDTDFAYSSIPTDMTQGDGGNEFLGAKFRIQRIRVFYDIDTTLSKGVRIAVAIPKDPSGVVGVTNEREAFNTHQDTVLYDMLLPNDPSCLSGTFDVVGPINVELNAAGTTPLRNNIQVYVHSDNVGLTLTGDVGYCVWYTDA